MGYITGQTGLGSKNLTWTPQHVMKSPSLFLLRIEKAYLSKKKRFARRGVDRNKKVGRKGGQMFVYVRTELSPGCR